PVRLGAVRARAAGGVDVSAQADGQALLCRHFPSRENDFQGTALADDTRQTYGSSIDQRHPPPTAIDAEVGILCHHAEITPQPQLHAAGDGGALDCRDDRLVQFEPRGPKRPAWYLVAVAARPRSRDIELAKRIICVERADVFEVPARTKGATRAIEDRNRSILVSVEFE